MPGARIEPEAMSRLLPRAALLKIPRQTRSIEMVHAILDAGKDLLGRDGMAAFNTNRVAEVAGVSVGSLYQYFANKDALLLGVVERGILLADEVVRDGLELLEEEDPERSVVRLLEALAAFLSPRRAFLREVLTGSALLTETGFLSMVETRVLELLRVLAQRHHLTAYSAADMFVAVNATCFLFLRWTTQPVAYISERELFEATARMVIAALSRCEQNAS